MLLTWTEKKDYDGHGNSWHEALSATSPDGRPGKYVIWPVLRGDRVKWTTAGSLPEVAEKDGCVFPSLVAAKEACEQAEAGRLGHVITAAEAIMDWAAKCKDTTFIDPNFVTQIISLAPPDAVRAQLSEWYADDKLKFSYGALSPGNGTFGSSSNGRTFWDSIDKIPRVLTDTCGDRFRTDAAEIVKGYRKPDNSPISTGI